MHISTRGEVGNSLTVQSMLSRAGLPKSCACDVGEAETHHAYCIHMASQLLQSCFTTILQDSVARVTKAMQKLGSTFQCMSLHIFCVARPDLQASKCSRYAHIHTEDMRPGWTSLPLQHLLMLRQLHFHLLLLRYVMHKCHHCWMTSDGVLQEQMTSAAVCRHDLHPQTKAVSDVVIQFQKWHMQRDTCLYKLEKDMKLV